MTEQQLTLFEEPETELTALWKAHEKLKQSQDKLRKRLFAEIGDLNEELIALRAENERLKYAGEAYPIVKWSA